MTFRTAFPMVCLIVVGACLVSVGCRPAEKAASEPPPRPPAEVVPELAAVDKDVIDYRVFTGRTAAVASVDIRARVSGFLVQSPERPSSAPSDSSTTKRSEDFTVTVREGEMVHGPRAPEGTLVPEGTTISKGTPIFEIDPKPYRLALAQAQGTLLATEAQLVRLLEEKGRVEELTKNNAISRSEYDLAVANYAETQGRIDNLTATVERAKLDLEFTRVTSPIDGILGRSTITLGNLVTADMTVLTTIVATDPIYVYFDVDEDSFLKYRELVRSGELQGSTANAVQVDMALTRDEGFPHRGTIDFQENTTDPDTGNTKLRAVFTNQQREISAGLFARVRVPFSKSYPAIVVPTAALAMDQQGRYVWTVNSDRRAQRKGVQIGSSKGNMTVITQGIAEGDRIIVEGLQKVQENTDVVWNEDKDGKAEKVKDPGINPSKATRSGDVQPGIEASAESNRSNAEAGK